MITKMNIIKNKTNHSFYKKGNVVISVIAFFTIFFAFSGFAIDFAYILTTRAKLQSATDATALMAAPYHINSGSAPTPKVFFAQYKSNALSTATIKDIKVKKGSKAVRVETECNAPVFFLSVLGISSVKIQARSSAQITTQAMTQLFFDSPYHYGFEAPSLITNKPGHDFCIDKASSEHQIEVYASLDNNKWLKIPQTSSSGTTYCYDLKDIEVTATKYLKIINVQYISTYPAPELQISNVTVTNPVKLIKNSTFNSL